MTYVPRCSRHERYPFDDCPPCDNEAARFDPREEGDEPERDVVRYERHLDEMGGSR